MADEVTHDHIEHEEVGKIAVVEEPSAAETEETREEEQEVFDSERAVD
ncbi:MAG: hypothetical protein ACI83O_000027 [Patescibacteria group bacterium]|jgi:hypothetical protein